MTATLVAPFGRMMNGHAARWRQVRSRGAPTRRREPELWERTLEEYPAATVLEDLLGAVGDAECAARIVARFSATRMVLIVLHGGTAAEELAVERTIARSYIESLPHGDAERRVLGRLVALTRSRLRRAVTTCANEAADLADARGHDAGAFWLRHIAYLLGVGCGWRDEALRAARAIQRVAQARGATHSERLWQSRLAALELASP